MKLNPYVILITLVVLIGALGFSYHAGGQAKDAAWQKRIAAQQIGFGQKIVAYQARARAAEAANEALNKKVSQLESDAENDPACHRLVDSEISKKLESIR